MVGVWWVWVLDLQTVPRELALPTRWGLWPVLLNQHHLHIHEAASQVAGVPRDVPNILVQVWTL